jgi:hypothetical protein
MGGRWWWIDLQSHEDHVRCLERIRARDHSVMLPQDSERRCIAATVIDTVQNWSPNFVCTNMLEWRVSSKGNFSETYCSSTGCLMALLRWLPVLELLRKIRMRLRGSCHGEALRCCGHEHLDVQSFRIFWTLNLRFFMHTFSSSCNKSNLTIWVLTLTFVLCHEKYNYVSIKSLISIIFVFHPVACHLPSRKHGNSPCTI